MIGDEGQVYSISQGSLDLLNISLSSTFKKEVTHDYVCLSEKEQ